MLLMERGISVTSTGNLIISKDNDIWNTDQLMLLKVAMQTIWYL